MPKYTKVIITGGTSVLNKGNYLDKKIPEIVEIAQQADKKEIDINSALNKCINYNYNINHEDMKKISAEFSMLNELKNNNYLDEDFNVSIIHTDTVRGIISANINKKIIEKYFNTRVKLIQADNIDVTDNVKLRRNLGDFMNKLTCELLYAGNEYAFFAPIGGYKIMTYLAYIVGSFYRYDTGYLYEETQKLIKIPPVPIEINVERILSKKELLKKMINDDNDIIKFSDLNDNDKEFIEQNSFFFEIVNDDNDNLVCLNAFGKFICEDYLTTKKLLSKNVITLLDDKNYKNLIENNLFKLITMIKKFYKDGDKEKDILGTIMHNKDWGINFPYLYKPKSRTNKEIFRCLWDYDVNEDEIKIYEIWLDHSKYEKDMNLIKSRKGYNTDVELIEFEI
ncbi:hypothetical protein FDN13_10355 [Caloramator sp. E03]|uniref:hypothetical protein n=1 Tax=Caloramator sp. E03 TaxID=2576307 RepID=UPI001110BE32|nr:hypothetical protein [Caloramator sp. E03]QCX34073.1 hypothetical protein FDN13_10355 [Caloramator sp. E03]